MPWPAVMLLFHEFSQTASSHAKPHINRWSCHAAALQNCCLAHAIDEQIANQEAYNRLLHGVQAELRWLDLSQCKLTNIQEELTRFPKLQMLYLHANQITKLSEVKKLGKLAGLQKLTLHGNPIAELPNYK